MPGGRRLNKNEVNKQRFSDITRIERGATTLDSQRLFEAMGHRTRMIGGQGRAMGIFIERQKEKQTSEMKYCIRGAMVSGDIMEIIAKFGSTGRLFIITAYSV